VDAGDPEARGERVSAEDAFGDAEGRTLRESEAAPEEEREALVERVAAMVRVPPQILGSCGARGGAAGAGAPEGRPDSVAVAKGGAEGKPGADGSPGSEGAAGSVPQNVGAFAEKLPAWELEALREGKLDAEGHAVRELERAGEADPLSPADWVALAPVAVGEGRGVREGAREGVAPALSLRVALSVRVGLPVCAGTVRVALTQAEAEVEALREGLRRGESDADGEPVSGADLVPQMVRVRDSVCVRVTRAEAESVGARLPEGLEVDEPDAERQRLPVAVTRGERDAAGLSESETEPAAERVAAEPVAAAVRVPPQILGPFAGRAGAPAPAGAPVGRPESVAVSNGGAEGKPYAEGTPGALGSGSSVKNTTSKNVAGAFAVRVGSGLRERDCEGDAVKEPLTEGEPLARGERLSTDLEAQGDAECERLPLPEADADARSDTQLEVVGLALLLRLSLRETHGEAEAEAEPPRPFVTVRVPLEATEGDAEAVPHSEGAAENVIEAELTSVKDREGVARPEVVPSFSARVGVSSGEVEASAEREWPPEAERATLPLAARHGVGVSVGADTEGAALAEASDAVGTPLGLGASDALSLRLPLALPVGLGERAGERLSVHDGESVGRSTEAVGETEGDVKSAPDAEASCDRDAGGERDSLGEPLGDALTERGVAERAGVVVRVPVGSPEVVNDTEGLPLADGERLQLTDMLTVLDATSVKVSEGVARGEREPLGEPESEGVRAARMMVADTVALRLAPEREGSGVTVRLCVKAPLAVRERDTELQTLSEGVAEPLPLREGVTEAEEQREGLALAVGEEDSDGVSVPVRHSLTVTELQPLALGEAASLHVRVPVAAGEALPEWHLEPEGLPLALRLPRGEAEALPASGKLVLVRVEEGAVVVLRLTAGDADARGEAEALREGSAVALPPCARFTKFAEGELLRVLCVPCVVKLCVSVTLALSSGEALSLRLPEGLPEYAADAEGGGVPGSEGEAPADSEGAPVAVVRLNTVRVGVTRVDAENDVDTDGEGEGGGERVSVPLAEGVRDAVVEGDHVREGAPEPLPRSDTVSLRVVVEEPLGATLADSVPVRASLGERASLTVSVPVRASLGERPRERLTVPVGRSLADAGEAEALSDAAALGDAGEAEALSDACALGDRPSEGVEEGLARELTETRGEEEAAADARAVGVAGEGELEREAACDGEAARDGLPLADAQAEPLSALADADAEGATEAEAAVLEGVRVGSVAVGTGDAETSGV